MDFIERLANFLRRPTEETADQAPPEVCPNCWGHQGYDGKVRTLFADKQIDVTNQRESHAFIRDFVVNQIDGIRLKKENMALSCPSCQTTYPTDA